MPHMERRMAGKLTVLQITKAQSGDVLHDGDGLIFQANGDGHGRWLYRYMLRGKRLDNETALGRLSERSPEVSITTNCY